MKHDCNQVTIQALEFKVWFDDETDLIMLNSHPGTGLCPMLNGCGNYVTQDKEVAVEETEKQDKQSEQTKVCVQYMITTKQKQRSK